MLSDRLPAPPGPSAAWGVWEGGGGGRKLTPPPWSHLQENDLGPLQGKDMDSDSPIGMALWRVV